MSGQHAALSWTRRGWEIRDLGSRNGTWVNGQRIDADQPVRLRRGDALSFGHPEPEFTLISVTGPSPLAEAGDDWLDGEGGLLALPDARSAEMVIFADPQHGWVARTEQGDRVVLPGDEVEVAGTRWQIELPEPVVGAVETGPIRATLDEIGLRFDVDENDFLQRYRVVLGDAEASLVTRAHHDVLLALAQARLVDAALGDDPSEHGWLRREDVYAMTGLSRNQLHVQIHRARMELEALDVSQTRRLIEARDGRDQVRLGIADLRIDRT